MAEEVVNVTAGSVKRRRSTRVTRSTETAVGSSAAAGGSLEQAKRGRCEGPLPEGEQPGRKRVKDTGRKRPREEEQQEEQQKYMGRRRKARQRLEVRDEPHLPPVEGQDACPFPVLIAPSDYATERILQGASGP